MQSPLPLLAVLLVGTLSAAPGASNDGSFTTIPRPAAPEVAYQLRNDSASNRLLLTISVAPLRPDWPAPQVNVGLSATRKILLSSKDARPEKTDGKWTYRFQVDQARLTAPGTPIEELRWAFDAAWVNPAGTVAERENFFVSAAWPVFRPIGDDPSNWAVFNLADQAQHAENLQQQFRVAWDQPFDGKASVVIEDAQGHRVRNLVSGQPFSAGHQTIAWDGADEAGNLVAPGQFTWRVAAHPGIRPEYLMSFYNPGQPPWKAGPTSSWMGDHTAPTCAASNGELIALGCPVAEAGNNIVIVDQQGRKLADGDLSSHSGLGNVFLAMDGKRYYALSEGAPAYGNLRKDADGKEYIYAELKLTAWTLDGQAYSYSEKGKFEGKTVREYKLETTSKVRHGGKNNLRGAAMAGPTLCLSLHDENKIQLLDPDTGNPTGDIAVSTPGPIASDGRRVVVVSGSSIALIDAAVPAAKPRILFPVKLSAPRQDQGQDAASSLAFNARNEIFVADNGVDQDIKVFDLTGKLLRRIGCTGGRAGQGTWQADGLRLPLGIALDAKGQLWVAENDPAPKRISVWNATSGALVKELFGPTNYGSPGGGFDTQDATQWVGAGARWKVDTATKTASIESVFYSPEIPAAPAVTFRPFSVEFVRYAGRTFLISKDLVMRLYELRPDGSAKLWAMFSTLRGFQAEHPRWWVPEAFTRAPLLKDVLKNFTEVVGPFGSFRNVAAESKSREGAELSVLWTDANGDGQCQAEEVQVVGGESSQLRAGAWGYHFTGLDWTLAAEVNGKAALAKLKLHGFLPSGAPDWRLKEALDGALPIDGYNARNVQSYALDHAGRLLVNADPMTAVTPDGKVAWTFPNAWTGVHGSHHAPLPEAGVMQGSLSYLGIAPLDAQGDVTVINGNHGRFFVMTTDGLYLDEMFKDVRLSREADAYRIGGECFGGFFARDEKTGRYLLQSGNSDYRIFELHGLTQLKRFQGTIDASADQIVAARKVQEKKLEETKRVCHAVIGTEAQVVAEWGDPHRSFPYAKISASRMGDELVLNYEVKDPSPWVNQGTDPQLLFKTGDAVLFEFSCDPKASPKRSGPMQGDKRLLLAPFQDKSVAVLYDYKVSGTTKPVVFNSPARSFAVDRVTTLDRAKLTVKKSKAGYTLTARIPLADLGLPATGQTASLKGDFGTVYGDEDGEINILRSNWSNPSTGLVNDVPGETAINPNFWGQLEWK